ncbi:rRNA methyltransferase 2, mitochondrial-like [Lycorma delicatula]|uniref:rRNA methyltransferase 2, mitochondrial-like n=1 Tax=Lycorma delicatula TaxID=130591 RepID=UPI003F5153E2
MSFLTCYVSVRHFRSTCSLYKEVLRTLKGRKTSSQEWLKRQFSDPYIEKAKLANYRCRSAFKLLEIDDKYKILKPGDIILDCGASPGSWSQIAVSRTNADKKDIKKKSGIVIGIDLKPVYPVDGAIFLNNCDFTEQSTKEKIIKILQEKIKSEDEQHVDVVLSDMAPNATGIKEMDHTNIIKLGYDVVRFGLTVSAVNGILLVKIWEGSQSKKIFDDISRFYNDTRYVKPQASRSDSAEIFILATGFKGIKR